MLMPVISDSLSRTLKLPPVARRPSWSDVYKQLFPDPWTMPPAHLQQAAHYLFTRHYHVEVIRGILEYVQDHGTVEGCGYWSFAPEHRQGVEALIPFARDSEWDQHDGTWTINSDVVAA
jgi:hypothetical protein